MSVEYWIIWAESSGNMLSHVIQEFMLMVGSIEAWRNSFYKSPRTSDLQLGSWRQAMMPEHGLLFYVTPPESETIPNPSTE